MTTNALSIHQQEEDLFAEWKIAWGKDGVNCNPNLFVKDGVVDERHYCASSLKLLFVLKEVNGYDEGKEWDLRDFVKDGGPDKNYDPTWSNIARWVEGIRNLPTDIGWSEINKFGQERRAAALSSIAALNLKKLPGNHTANTKEIERFVTQDASFLKRQIKIYEPDITVCCGTTSNYERLVLGQATWCETQRGVMYCEPVPNRYVVSYAHPGARVQDSLKYYGLVDAIREILNAPR